MRNLIPASLFAGWLLFATGWPSFAEDLTTVGGRTLKSIEVLGTDGDGATLKHSGGTEKIGWPDLPMEFKKVHNPRLVELEQKQNEIEKLKEQLRQAQNEISQLKQEKQKAVEEKQQAVQEKEKAVQEKTQVTVAAARAGVPLDEKPKQMPAALPPLQPDDTVDARELLLQFRADGPAARRRYADKQFKITGTVARFDPASFRQVYSVILDAGGYQSTVICKFGYAEGFRSVVPRRNGKTLVAVDSYQREREIFHVGQSVTLRGRCKGLEDGEVILTGCAVAK